MSRFWLNGRMRNEGVTEPSTNRFERSSARFAVFFFCFVSLPSANLRDVLASPWSPCFQQTPVKDSNCPTLVLACCFLTSSLLVGFHNDIQMRRIEMFDIAVKILATDHWQSFLRPFSSRLPPIVFPLVLVVSPLIPLLWFSDPVVQAGLHFVVLVTSVNSTQ